MGSGKASNRVPFCTVRSVHEHVRTITSSMVGAFYRTRVDMDRNMFQVDRENMVILNFIDNLMEKKL